MAERWSGAGGGAVRALRGGGGAGARRITPTPKLTVLGVVRRAQGAFRGERVDLDVALEPFHVAGDVLEGLGEERVATVWGGRRWLLRVKIVEPALQQLCRRELGADRVELGLLTRHGSGQRRAEQHRVLLVVARCVVRRC